MTSVTITNLSPGEKQNIIESFGNSNGKEFYIVIPDGAKIIYRNSIFEEVGFVPPTFQNTIEAIDIIEYHSPLGSCSMQFGYTLEELRLAAECLVLSSKEYPEPENKCSPPGSRRKKLEGGKNNRKGKGRNKR